MSAVLRYFLTPPIGLLNPQAQQPRARRYSFIFGNQGAPPPQITNVSPAAGSAMSSSQVWGGDVISPTGVPLSICMLLVQYPTLGTYEVIYDGIGFASAYQGNVAPLSNGFAFSNVIRRGGWPAVQVEIIVVAVDANGNVNS